MKPPAWAATALALLYPESLLEAIAGAARARRWYAQQVADFTCLLRWLRQMRQSQEALDRMRQGLHFRNLGWKA